MAAIDLSKRTPTISRPPGFWQSLLSLLVPRSAPGSRRSPVRIAIRPASMPADKSAASDAVPGSQRAPETSRPQDRSGIPNTSPRTTPAQRTPPASTEPKPAKSAARPSFLIREAVSAIGIGGAALTLLSHLAWQVRMAPELLDVAGSWYFTVANVWRELSGLIGPPPHTHMQAALTLAFFLVIMGIGARLSAQLLGRPPEANRGLIAGIPLPSLILVLAVTAAFAFIYQPGAGDILLEQASRENVVLSFAAAIGAGYLLGSGIGQRGFHIRVYILAMAVAGALAWNASLLSTY